MGCVVYMVVIILYYLLIFRPVISFNIDDIFIFHPEKLFSSLPIFIFAYTCHQNVCTFLLSSKLKFSYLQYLMNLKLMQEILALVYCLH